VRVRFPNAFVDANSNEIFYPKSKRDGEVLQVMAVDVAVATQPSFSASTPPMLFEGRYPGFYAVMPDGKHFLLLKPELEQPPRQIQIVLNWFEGLKRRIPAAGKEDAALGKPGFVSVTSSNPRWRTP